MISNTVCYGDTGCMGGQSTSTTVKENPMGRPINKKWFGIPDGTHHKIVVNGVMWANGDYASDAYIVRQVGTRKYIVSDGVTTEPAYLVNTDAVEGLEPGQCFIMVTAYGNDPAPCQKIAQYRVSLFETDGSIKIYSWGGSPATRVGQADINLRLNPPD